MAPVGYGCAWEQEDFQGKIQTGETSFGFAALVAQSGNRATPRFHALSHARGNTMAASQFDVMIELETTGKPISVSVYQRIDRLPRQGSRDVQDFHVKNQFPAEHSPDEIPEINRRVVVKVLNVDKRCLCNTPMMAGLRPKHIGEWNHDQSQFLCDRSAGFEPEEVQYYQRYRFGEKLYTFLQGGSRRISYLLRSLAEDQWQLDIGSKALRGTWPCVPEITLQAKLALLLLDSQ